jgi:protein-tyrosine phosphatase
MKSVLVICVGNICRSPLAEGLMAKQLPQIQVSSAGLAAVVGASADPKSAQIARVNGFDISTHRAKQVTSWMCQRADLILVMEKSHRTDLMRMFPWVQGKVFCLAKEDIPDPYRQSVEIFNDGYRRICDGVGEWVKKINHIAGS